MGPMLKALVNLQAIEHDLRKAKTRLRQAETDIGEQSGEFRQQPGVLHRRQVQHEDQSDARDEKQGVDNMRRNLCRAVVNQARSSHHPGTSQQETGNRQNCEGRVKIFNNQIHANPFP